MSVVLWIVAVLLAIVWAFALVDIIRRHLGAKRTAAWLLIVLILPFLGAILYWAMRPSSGPSAEEQAALDQETRREAARTPFDSTRLR